MTSKKNSRKNSVDSVPMQPGRNGGRLRRGNPGNSGGKAGFSGRLPEEFKEHLRVLASRPETLEVADALLRDPTNPGWLAVWRFVVEQSFGKAVQPLEHDVQPDLGEALKMARERVAKDKLEMECKAQQAAIEAARARATQH